MDISPKKNFCLQYNVSITQQMICCRCYIAVPPRLIGHLRLAFAESYFIILFQGVCYREELRNAEIKRKKRRREKKTIDSLICRVILTYT
ncbi:hypothetical protein B9Z55_022158 [Caenorhabditis nigoni]|uniref:Uncharacterized protein n=1 Tax=Caenorhabditis nigoni TaxID=1611254 RepID=A0A2G5TV28_9PELO|nr:hypothetical protein B9Z55_022158 [Caenorhabditis nigoni]